MYSNISSNINIFMAQINLYKLVLKSLKLGEEIGVTFAFASAVMIFRILDTVHLEHRRKGVGLSENPHQCSFKGGFRSLGLKNKFLFLWSEWCLHDKKPPSVKKRSS